jgi:hypothetical protein
MGYTQGSIPLIVPPESLTAIAATKLGKHVSVVMAWQDFDVAEKSITGTLLQVSADGCFTIRDNETFEVMYCWPWLQIEEIGNEADRSD